MMEKVSSLVVDLIYVCPSLQEFLNLVVLSPYQCVLESKESTNVHLINVGTHIKHSVSQVESMPVIEVKEWSSSLVIWIVNPDVQVEQCVKQVCK